MIEKISIKNFKSHADTTIELGRVTALVGPNGCGKTSVLQAIHSFCQSITSPLNQVFFQEQTPSFLVRQGEESFSITMLVSADAATKLEITLQFYKDSDYHWQPKVTLENTLLDPKHAFQPQINWDTTLTKALTPDVRKLVGRSAYFKADTSKLAKVSYIENTEPVIATDGSGLASAVAYLMTTSDDNASGLLNSLVEIVPLVKRFRVKPAKVELKEKKVLTVNGATAQYEETREVVGHELVFDTTSGKNVPAHAMSNGTLLTLGLLTAIYNAPNCQIILLDDIEQGLHPLAQRKLIKTICEFAEKHDKQILLTTHSGYIVDELEPENVWVMQTDKEGIGHAKRLSEHEDAKRLLEVLTTGELADAVGEDWVLPQVPQAIAVGEANA